MKRVDDQQPATPRGRSPGRFGDDRFMAKGCDCDPNELLKVPIFPHTSKASYIPTGERGGLVYCERHHGWVNFDWVKP